MSLSTAVGGRPGSDLVGRSAELAALLDALDRHPQVTVVGPGGVGKSALAFAAAWSGRDRWPDGIIACDLADVLNPGAVRPTVATAAGVVLAEDAALTSSLAGRRALVLLDSSDHVLDAARSLVRELLAAGPGIRVLVTSRESVAAPGERVFPVAPLAVPDDDADADPGAGAWTDIEQHAANPAVDLFCKRALEARPDFALGPENIGDVVALCRRLDGLPLALELAAARTRAMTPAEILQRLAAGLPLTAPGKSPASARHRSLAAVVDWSYDLLDEQARTVYERLGVAAGGVLLEAAEAICTAGPAGREDVAAVLDALVDRSLVMVSEHHGRTRYAMLDTLRSDALRRLTARGDADAARDRHADHFAAVSDRIRAAYSRGVPAVWVAWLGDDVHNVRSALRWCLDRDDSPDRAFRLTAALWSLCFEGHARSVADIVDETLRRWPPHTHPLGPEVAGVGAVAYLVVDDPADSRRLAEMAREAAGRSAWPPPTLALRVLAELAVWHDGDVERGLSLLTQARDAADRAGNSVAATDVEHVRLMAVAETGDLEAARILAEQLHARAVGTSAFESLYARLVLCLVTSADDVGTAAAMLEETLAEEDIAATSLGRMLADLALGTIRTLEGRRPEAAAAFARALDHGIRTGARRFWVSKVGSVLPLLVQADRPAARRLWAAALASGAHVIRLETLGLERAVQPLGHIDPQPMSPREALELARDEMLLLAQTAAETPGSAAGEQVRTPGAPVVDRGGASAPAAAHRPPPAMWRAGPLWTLRWEGRETHVRDTKGLQDLSRLLGEPGRELHVLDLAGEGAAATASGGHLGDALDATARAAYRARIVTLREAVADAEDIGHAARAEAARTELEALVKHLSSAYGLGGRARRTGDAAERARSAVGWRIRSALRRVDAGDPQLAQHLRESLRLGTFCVYDPQPPVRWDVRAG